MLRRSKTVQIAIAAWVLAAVCVLAVAVVRHERAVESSADAARRVVRTYALAVAAGDSAAACAQLSPAARRAFRPAAPRADDPCRAVMRMLGRNLDGLRSIGPRATRAAIANPRVRIVASNERGAQARLSAPIGGDYRVARSGGGWRIVGMHVFTVTSTASSSKG